MYFYTRANVLSIKENTFLHILTVFAITIITITTLLFLHRRISTATTYNPNNFNSNTQRSPQTPTTPRESTYVSGSARPFSSTTRLPSTTTTRPKSGKKNDYDYAYYDNTAGLEYDSLDLEHVTGNKESTKIARN